MLISTRGIVLRQTKYGDTSVICTLYTEALGIQSYLVNGIRSSKSRQKANLLRPMSLLQLVVYHREGKNLQRIKEMSHDYLYQSVLFDIPKGAIGLFMIEVLNKVLKEEGTNESLYAFLHAYFVDLDQAEKGLALYPLLFLLRLSSYLGFFPHADAPATYFDLEEGQFTMQRPLHPNYIDRPISDDLYSLVRHVSHHTPAPSLDRPTRRILLGDLLRYYSLHIAGFQRVNAHAILESIFN